MRGTIQWQQGKHHNSVNLTYNILKRIWSNETFCNHSIPPSPTPPPLSYFVGRVSRLHFPCSITRTRTCTSTYMHKAMVARIKQPLPITRKKRPQLWQPWATKPIPAADRLPSNLLLQKEKKMFVETTILLNFLSLAATQISTCYLSKSTTSPAFSEGFAQLLH